LIALVIDASATAPLLLDDERGDVVPEALDAVANGTCIAPGNWPYEMANVIWKTLRAKRIMESEVDLIRSALAIFAVKIDRESVGEALARTLDLAVAHDLTAYDAAYLELAIRRKAALASYDADLRAAAKREGIVVFPA
jgi:predicted nucleic acid-binding protein